MKAARGPEAATQDWAHRFRLKAVLEHGLDPEAIERELAEVEAAAADADSTPEALFGDPDQHARLIAADQPVAARADAEADPGLVTYALIVLGMVAPVGAVYIVLGGSWSAAMSAADLVGSALLVATTVAATSVVWLRRAGLPAISWIGVAATAALVVAAATVLTGGAGGADQQIVMRLPAVVLALAGLGLLALAFALPDRAPREPQRGRSRSAGAWYRRLGGLLRGRHRFPLSRTRDLVAEARSHVAASGAIHPSDDLGEPAHHALALAQASTYPKIAATRTERVGKIAVPVLLTIFTFMAIDSYLEGGPWTRLIAPSMLALAGLWKLLTWCRRR